MKTLDPDFEGIAIDFTRFIEPEAIEEAEDRLVEIESFIAHINFQLDDKNRQPDMTPEKYQEWRLSAAHARRLQKAEQGWLRNWIKRSKIHLRPEDMKAGGLLLASLPILNTAAESGLVDDGNLVILEAVRGYIKSRFPSVGSLITGTTSLEETNAA